LKENILKFKNYDLIITTVNLPYTYDNIIKISPTFTSFEKFKLTELRYMSSKLSYLFLQLA